MVDWEDRHLLTELTWSVKRKGAGHGPYAQHTSKANGRKVVVSLHRLIAGAGPGDHVDHINGDTLDNRRRNLRICTPRENSTNVTSSKHQKAGGFKGVCWHKKGRKWEAYIAAGEKRPNGKRKRLYLGLFTDPVQAAKAYDTAAREHFGEFAALNFPHGAPGAIGLGGVDDEPEAVGS